ncbi:GDP-mannose-dependent alpha-(1-6)-phosphatidylinositol monomannoside mannosyltransferase [Stieleria magnilauensis]|uniref:GDP-mannose-dependent alpha-(1-6)-phosphatidylinositol monomannoside mannosyltransferase n=2 Tax=Stieleria magnilauensis TaxID=2527963 RepID=A0ABX5XM36_9BACT|nr:GDP-mannose-dependent alpha-(1-6)-phosphatidylinositol monomannoside mannosyltransferase [Planctomycetes bacterium TBK1r]
MARLPIERLTLASSEWGLKSVSGLLYYRRIYRATKQLLLSNGSQWVHAGRCLPEGWIAWMHHKIRGTRYLVYVHGEDVEAASSSREQSWMVRRVFSNAERLISNSESTARILRDRWQVEPKKICVMHPGVDTERFVPAINEIRRSGWTSRTVVLTVGRLQERKGHDTMIRAIPELLRHVPDLLYAIAGDGDERRRLVKLAADQGVSDRVEFLGEVSDSELLTLYQQCDVFALPNRTVGRDIEGFGIVLLEAQACGRPVIAGDSGGTCEAFLPGRTGVLADCTSPESLAANLLPLLKDPVLRSEMGKSGRRWVLDNLSWVRLSEQAKELIAEVESDLGDEGRNRKQEATSSHPQMSGPQRR